ncbi:energy transducer TonB [Sphingomonas sp. Mn802worker]|uniref:energy transducer TonB n=1 Tax=Sphingomonas sp. Mn802worker TaxID=629773 RepID=UPI001EE6B3C5|nr:energy transducer TonB [Sphingomonas sp. Mn802worker]
MALAGPAIIYPGPTPIGDPARWIGPSDYPADAIFERKQGVSVVEVTVDPTGHAVQCRVPVGSGSVSLDKTACAAVAGRGLWQPTIDQSGKPIFAIYRQRVSWMLPGPLFKSPGVQSDMQIEVAKLPVSAGDATVVVRQIQRADGSQESCEVVQPSPSPALNSIACIVGAQLTATAPIGDAAGQRVRGARWRMIEFVEKGAAPPSK